MAKKYLKLPADVELFRMRIDIRQLQSIACVATKDQFVVFDDRMQEAILDGHVRAVYAIEDRKGAVFYALAEELVPACAEYLGEWRMLRSEVGKNAAVRELERKIAKCVEPHTRVLLRAAS